MVYMSPESTGVYPSTRIDDIELAQIEAAKINTGYDEATELGIRDLANETVIAHGQRYSVAAALAECEQFGQVIRSVAKGTESLPEEMRQTVIKSTVQDMVDRSKEAPVPDAVKEKVAAETIANEKVKKN